MISTLKTLCLRVYPVLRWIDHVPYFLSASCVSTANAVHNCVELDGKQRSHSLTRHPTCRLGWLLRHRNTKLHVYTLQRLLVKLVFEASDIFSDSNCCRIVKDFQEL